MKLNKIARYHPHFFRPPILLQVAFWQTEIVFYPFIYILRQIRSCFPIWKTFDFFSRKRFWSKKSILKNIILSAFYGKFATKMMSTNFRSQKTKVPEF